MMPGRIIANPGSRMSGADFPCGRSHETWMIRTTNGRQESVRSVEVHEVTRTLDDDTVDIGLSSQHSVVESIYPARAFTTEYPSHRHGQATDGFCADVLHHDAVGVWIPLGQNRTGVA